MATSLQQLLDALAERTAVPTTVAAIEDVTGALAHLGRAFAGMTQDGLTAGVSRRQQTAAQLTTVIEVDVSRIAAIRAKAKNSFAAE